MIFDLTKSFVPEAYVDSRDYRVFLRQLGILLSVFKFNIDHFPDLYDADDCPDHMVPLLASMVGYKYSDDRTIEGNRTVIKYFPYLIRNRGSELGIKLATVLSINTTPGIDQYYSINRIIVDVDLDYGVIKIYYPIINFTVDWDLIEVVRPVGMRIELIPSDIADSTEELDLKVTARAYKRNKYYDQSIVNQSQVGLDVNIINRNNPNQEY